MDNEQAHAVFELNTPDDVELFCRMLRRLKDTAPGSLRFLVSVSAERSVNFRSTKAAPRGRGIVGRIMDKVSRRL